MAVLQPIKIIPVLLCRTSWICCIMDHNPMNLINRCAGSWIWIYIQKLHINHRLWRIHVDRSVIEWHTVCSSDFSDTRTKQKNHCQQKQQQHSATDQAVFFHRSSFSPRRSAPSVLFSFICISKTRSFPVPFSSVRSHFFISSVSLCHIPYLIYKNLLSSHNFFTYCSL